MTFFDWNANGKIDGEDMFLEYMIFCDCVENENIFGSDDFEEYDEFIDEE